MTTAVEVGIGRVHATHLADGKLVQLSGRLGEAELPALRLALLVPMLAECKDIVIDAGEVEAIDDAVVAVLMAARDWADSQGVRLRLSRTSFVFDLTLEELGVSDLLPHLAALGTPRPLSAAGVPVPQPRSSAD